MSGHSKWATIKHKKGALDAKRGKIFTRLIKEITIAAKNGGGDPDGNPRLRTAILAAKAENMPADNIKRAIQRGTGELEGVNYEEITFEGYGPGGVAIIVEVLTDNRNRTVSEIRHAFSKNGGNLGETGSVRIMFSKKGIIAIEKSAATEEKLMDIVLEHGGEDLRDEGDTGRSSPSRTPSKRSCGGEGSRTFRSPRAKSRCSPLPTRSLKAQQANADDPAAGSARRLRRHAECLFELRYECRTDGASGGIRSNRLAIQGPPEHGGLFHEIQIPRQEKEER